MLKTVLTSATSFRVAVLLLVAVAVAGCVLSDVPPPPTAAASATAGSIDSGSVAWLLISSGLVLLMTPGLSFFYGGLVKRETIISTMMQSIVSMSLIGIVWVVVGFSLAYGDDCGHVVGSPTSYYYFRNVGELPDLRFAPKIPFTLFGIFQLKFAVVTPAIISGSFVERVNFQAYLLFTTIWSIVVYCPFAHWCWHPDGFLKQWGMLDFAGGCPVHMASGWAALAGALALGRRRVAEEGGGKQSPPANIPFVILGAALLWIGWFGFNGGSALAANSTAVLAFLNTNTSTATAMLTWLLVDGAQQRKLSAVGACTGALAGLVVITPGAGYVNVGPSFVFGLLAAVVCNTAIHHKEQYKMFWDDALDVFPCHGLCGILGMLLTAIFANDGGVVHSGSWRLFGVHCLAILIISAYAFVASYLLYRAINVFLPLRVADWKQELGLDIYQFDETIVDRCITDRREGEGPEYDHTALPHPPEVEFQYNGVSNAASPESTAATSIPRSVDQKTSQTPLQS